MQLLSQWRDGIHAWVLAHAHGPYANPFLFLFSYIEAIFSPIPIETALVPLVLSRVRSWLYYANVAALGSTLGGLTGYFIGYFFYDTLGVWIVETYSLAEEAAAIRAALSSHVFTATFVAAFTPFPDKVYMPIAGLMHAPFLLFFAALILGRLGRSYLVAYVTHAYGPAVLKNFLRYFRECTVVAGVVLAALLVWFFLR